MNKMSPNILDLELLDSKSFSAPSRISALSQQRSWSRSTTTTSIATSAASTNATTTTAPIHSKRKRPSQKKEDTWDPNFVMSLATHLPPSLKPTLIKIAKSDDALGEKLIQQLKFKQPPTVSTNDTTRRKRKLEEFEEEQAEQARIEAEVQRKKEERERKKKCREMDAVLGLNPLKGMRFEEREPFERKTRNSRGGRVAVNQKSKEVEEEEEKKRKMEEMDRVLGLLPKAENAEVEKEEELVILDSQNEGSKADSIDAEYVPLKDHPAHPPRDTDETVTLIDEETTAVTTTTTTTTVAAAAKEQSDASSITGSSLESNQVETRDTMLIHLRAYVRNDFVRKRNFDIIIYKKPTVPATPTKRGRGRPRKSMPLPNSTYGRREKRRAARMVADGGFKHNGHLEDGQDEDDSKDTPRAVG